MPCGLGNPAGCAGDVIGGLVGDAASSAWNDVCKSFADAAASLLSSFAKAFVAIPAIDLTGGGVRNVYTLSISLAAVVCALLLIGQVIRTALTHDGSALARGLTGVGKAALACLLTLSVAEAGLRAADEVTSWIVNASFGSQQALASKVSGVFAWNPNLSGALLLVLAVVAILLVIVLWFELLLRSAAVAILVATAPIAAAGQASDSTRSWWPRLVSATAQLIIVKPVIALVFAVGFGLAGGAQNVEALLTGLLVLLLAVLAWPAVARFFTFSSMQAGGGAGLAGLLGFAAGAASSRAGGSPGVAPEAFSQTAEARTTAALQDRGAFTPALAGAAVPGGASGGGASAGGASAGAAGSGAGGMAAAGGAAAGPAGMAAAGLSAAQRAVNALTGRMEQMAGHAGLPSQPNAHPAGYSQQGSGYGGTPGPSHQPGHAASAQQSTGPAEGRAPYGPAPEDDPLDWEYFQPDAKPAAAREPGDEQAGPPAAAAGDDQNEGEQQ